MQLRLLSPAGLLVCVAALLPLAGLVLAERRSYRVARALRLRWADTRRRRIETALALTAVAALLGLAAAQPAIGSSRKQRVNVDAEVLFVFDVTKSMQASRGPDDPTRLEQAKDLALRIRPRLGGVQVGVASITQRVLPYLFPTPDDGVFAATVRESVAIDSPPPGTGTFAAVLNSPRGVVTDLSALAALSGENYFLPGASHRLAILLSDDESIPLTTDAQAALSHLLPRVHVIAVRVGDPSDHIYLPNGQPDTVFHGDPGSALTAAAIAHATRGRPFDGGDSDAIVRAARDNLSGGRIVDREIKRTPRPLAPWIAALALLPLALVLRRRNL